MLYFISQTNFDFYIKNRVVSYKVTKDQQENDIKIEKFH